LIRCYFPVANGKARNSRDARVSTFPCFDTVHVVDMEILNNAQLGTGTPAAKRPESSFKIALENSRGRAYDLVLKPGESTSLFTRPANTGIFVISGGRVGETAEGKAPRLLDSEPGDFRWIDLPEKLTITNNSTKDEEFVEIELN
jgi:hypothetical protein